MSKWYPPEEEYGTYRKEINVDCDSLSAIVVDVVRRSGV